MHSLQNANILLLVIFQVKPFYLSWVSFFFFFPIWLPVDFHPLGKSFHPILSSLTLSNQVMTHSFLIWRPPWLYNKQIMLLIHIPFGDNPHPIRGKWCCPACFTLFWPYKLLDSRDYYIWELPKSLPLVFTWFLGCPSPCKYNFALPKISSFKRLHKSVSPWIDIHKSEMFIINFILFHVTHKNVN